MIVKSDYVTIYNRAQKLKLDIIPNNSHHAIHTMDMVITVDSTGIKITNRGDWIRHKHGKRPKLGYVKIHAAVDTKSKCVTGFRITKESVHDSQEFMPLIDQHCFVEQLISIHTPFYYTPLQTQEVTNWLYNSILSISSCSMLCLFLDLTTSPNILLNEEKTDSTTRLFP